MQSMRNEEEKAKKLFQNFCSLVSWDRLAQFASKFGM